MFGFFSGSASSFDAIMQLNTEDNGKRKMISIQIDEDLNEKYNSASKNEKAKLKMVLDFLESVGRTSTLNQVGIERIIRAAKKIKDENPDTTADLGFKHYILKEPSGKQLSEIIDFDRKANELVVANNLVEEFGADTVLTTWLIRDGYGFSPKFHTVNFGTYTGYHMDKYLYLINKGLDNDAIEAIVTKFDMTSFNPENVVLFGYNFYMDRDGILANKS